MSDGYCNQTPVNAPWPVCHLVAGHDGNHESADFWWENGQAYATVIGQQKEYGAPYSAGELWDRQ